MKPPPKTAKCPGCGRRIRIVRPSAVLPAYLERHLVGKFLCSKSFVTVKG